MGRRVATNSDTQTRKHMRCAPPADQAGTSSSFVKPRKSTKAAVQQPPPLAPTTSIDSFVGSWSTLSAPKSILRQTAGTGPSQAQPFPPAPTSTLLSRTQKPSSSSKFATKKRHISAEQPRQSVASTSRLPLGSRRPSSPPPVPVALRSLVPEPAPPPAGSTDRISSKKITSSSRDRPPPLNRTRRISTPYPHVGARPASRQPPPRPRKKMTRKSDGPHTTPQYWTPVPQAGFEYLQNLALNMPTAQPLIPRRASPVPASSSKSDSSRSSSESYVSLNDEQPQDTPESPQDSQPSDFIALAPHMSSSKTPSSNPISPPTAGIPQIFSRHLIPLPTLTFPSLRGLRPTALPTTTIEVASTVEDPNGTEYASDHPHDLQLNSLLMPEELDRVRVWAVNVEIAIRETMVEGSTPGVEDDEIVPEAWDWEKPAKIDVELLVPGREPATVSAVTLVDSPVASRSAMMLNDSPRSQPFPPSVFRAFPVPQSAFERTVPQTAYTFTTIPSPLPPKQTVSTDQDDNQVNLDSEHEEDGQSKPPIITTSSVDGETSGQGGLTSLIPPSPFSPLPSPFRPMGVILCPVPKLLRTTALSRSTPLRQMLPATPLPPSPIQEPSLASPISPRPHSPEAPGRIRHTSTEREDAATTTFHKQKSKARDRSGSSDDTLNSGGTRGRSPTRRSWKASSQRASLRTKASALAIQAYLQSLAPETKHPESATSYDLGSLTRPRTSSMTSSRYSAHVPAERPQEAEEVEMRNTMRSRSSIATGELFFHPSAAVVAAPSEVRLNSDPTSPGTATRAQQSFSGTIVPASKPTPPNPPRRISDSVQEQPRPEVGSISLLRRRKSHRAPRSVLSLPSEQDSDETEAKPAPTPRPNRASPKRQSRSSCPPSPRQEVPRSTQRSRSMSRHDSSMAVNANRPPPARTLSGSVQAPSNPSLAFMKLITLITQFTSDLSTGRQGRPRWKIDCPEFQDEVDQVYEVFRENVEKTRIKFRPWLRNEISRDDERELESDAGHDNDTTIMYLEDVWDRLYGSGSSIKNGASALSVQDDLVQSVVSSWDELLSSCLQGVTASLEQLVTMIVDTHFGCAGDGEELRRIVQTIASMELSKATKFTEVKVSELYRLEATSTFSIKARQSSVAAASLARYRSLRQRAQVATLDRAQCPSSSSPIPVPYLRQASLSPLKKTPHVHSSSWDTHASTLPSSIGGKTGSSSQGKQSSTLATSLLPDAQNSDEDTAVAFTRLRRFSLLGGDSPEYRQEVQLALTTLANLGFKDITTPEKLYAKLADLESPESMDEVLEVMANVDAYLDAASARFIDYVAMHIENNLVNTIGEKINTAVLSTLDLASDGIKEQCVRWMS